MSFFEGDIPVFYASSPGRMDVMGGIADYSGSLLLQMPVKQITTVALQKRNDKRFELQSVTSEKKVKIFSIDVDLIRDKEPVDAGKIIRSQPGGDWAAYVIGCFHVLQKEKGLMTNGASVRVSSTIPLGKGVSSSAALEVATMHAICEAYQLSLEATELAILAQQAENLVVGSPCGLMDQLSVELGQKKKLLPLICQLCTVMQPVNIPKGIEFCGIDSGIRHAVSGASYSEVRAAAFMGYTIIAKGHGVTVKQLQKAKESNDWSLLPYRGYLANISVQDFESKYEKLLPVSITGKEFLDNFGISVDRVTSIDASKNYNVKACAKHPVFENSRVNSFLEHLKLFSKSAEKEKELQQMGELMYQCHDSYSSVGLGNDHTDEIIRMVKEAGVASGVYGARITGGGSGGTVVILCYGKEGKETAKEIYRQYKKKYKKKIFFFQGSSHGASTINNNN